MEPQSYGSRRDWVEGDTPQTVQETPHRERRHDEAFYRSDRDEQTGSARESTARTEMDEPRRAPDTAGASIVGTGGKKVPETNETRQSYFRERDYD